VVVSDIDPSFSAWNDVMAAIVKAWRQIENPTQSIGVHLREE